MMRHRAVLSTVAILLTVALWLLSPYPLAWIGLEMFDPLDRICLIVLVLSLADAVFSRTLSE